MRFDQRAHSYDRHAIPQKAFAARVAGFLEAQPGTQVLELGAGTGALTSHLCRMGLSVDATDRSEHMVRIGAAAAPGARWSLLDAFSDPIPRAPLQVSSGLLQWAPHPDALLRKWASGLPPGGRMLHGLACDPCLKEWRTLLPEGPIHWRTETQWIDLFSAAGLRIARRALWVEELIFPTALHLAQSLHGSGVTGDRRLSTAQLRTALKAYEARFRKAKGVFSTWAWMAIEAMP